MLAFFPAWKFFPSITLFSIHASSSRCLLYWYLYYSSFWQLLFLSLEIVFVFGTYFSLYILLLILLFLLSSASSRSPEHSAVTAVVLGIEPTTLEAFAAPVLSDMSVLITRSCLTRSGSPVSQSSIIGVTSVNLSVFSLKIILLIPAAPPKFSPKG